MIIEQLEKELNNVKDCPTTKITNVIYNYFEKIKEINDLNSLYKEFYEYKSIRDFLINKAADGSIPLYDLTHIYSYIFKYKEIYFNSLKISEEVSEFLTLYKLNKLLTGDYCDINSNNATPLIIGDFEFKDMVGATPSESIKKYAYTTKWEAK